MEKVNPATGRTILGLANGGSAAKAEAYKIASCEISDAAEASERPEAAPAADKDSDHDAAVSLAAVAPPQHSNASSLEKPVESGPAQPQQARDRPLPEKPAESASDPQAPRMAEAIAEATAARATGGMLFKSGIAPKGAATLSACLRIRQFLGDDSSAYDEFREHFKLKTGRLRSLNRENLRLIAINSCHDNPSPAQRKEFSRFADVLLVAEEERVQPDEADSWLKKRKQADILNKARALKGKKPRDPVVATSAKVRPNIWNALKARKGEHYKLAVKRLDELEAVLAREPKPRPPDENASNDATATTEPTEAPAEPVTGA